MDPKSRLQIIVIMLGKGMRIHQKLAVNGLVQLPVVTMADLIAAGDQCECMDLRRATMADT